ncbi:hypothetical protein [Marinomonas balearica]|uniref:Uncharacterized protein n=1 Tax=Marinomonas balearica TaxID=491947 RepID=A0A4R6M2X9_9GAMM|nr:hypothetical protein [Marinomonas balearica]TDO95346.1 hypothetical protein DFP79_3587 [Marinomonas balearica]
MSTKTYDELVREVRLLTDSIANDPEGRLKIRTAFYDKYGYVEQDGHSYGRSELAFLKWEIKRGTLNPIDNTKHSGSVWWRNTNLNFIFLSELAGMMKENNVVNPDAPMPVQNWLNFINDPTPKNWYIAHNSTILDGYKRYEGCVALENDVEKEFLNITLYRLMFAQAMVEEVTIFPELAEYIADPRGIGVTLLTKLPDFYPPNYPLTKEDLEVILGKEGGWQDDMVFIMNTITLSHLRKLYKEASKWNESPFLMDFVKTKSFLGIKVSKPVYGKREGMPDSCSNVIGV